ncbi:cold shock domain-containing protein [Micromonospora sp. STR1s_5]|nr:cold shock domain-containing protein [Micromonospora sp. STR1s_5]
MKYVEPNGRWGFISRDDKQPKVYVHISVVQAAGEGALEKGQRWRFDVTLGTDSRYAAVNLERV